MKRLLSFGAVNEPNRLYSLFLRTSLYLNKSRVNKTEASCNFKIWMLVVGFKYRLQLPASCVASRAKSRSKSPRTSV